MWSGYHVGRIMLLINTYKLFIISCLPNFLASQNYLERNYKQKFLKKKENIEREVERISNTIIRPTKEVNEFLKGNNSSEIATGVRLSELLKRTELNYEILAKIDKNRPELEKLEKEEVEIQIKYEGYIAMQISQVEKFKKMEQKKLSEDIDYETLKGLSLEARQKLNKYKPTSVGMASRISGVSPADISVLLIYLETKNRK